MPQDMPNPEHGDRSLVDHYLHVVHNEHSETLAYVSTVMDYVQANFNGAHLIYDGTIKSTAAIGLVQTVSLERGHWDNYQNAFGILVSQTYNAGQRHEIGVVDAHRGIRGPSKPTTEFDDKLSTPKKVVRLFMRTMDASIPEATHGRIPNSVYKTTANWRALAGCLLSRIEQGEDDFIPHYRSYKK
jgi:hypothetical protein